MSVVAPPTGKPRRRLAKKIALASLAVLGLGVVLAGGAGLWYYRQIRASLPQLDGERALPGLGAPVEIERDDLGVPTLRAASRTDAARALGFVHAQDRFFQMDLQRRQGAGELAKLFGPALLETDKEHRVHRFRDRARRVVEAADGEQRAVLEAYAAGVNAGLSALEAKPFEYVLTGSLPAPWAIEDSVLVVLSMFLELQDGKAGREADLALLAEAVPRPMFELLAPLGTEWDAPLVGQAVATPAFPGPEVFDLRQPQPLPKAAALSRRPGLPRAAAGGPEDMDSVLGAFALGASTLGSNNWALAASRTADGRAWLANDMHLPLAVPNIWYRASIERPDGAGGSVRVTGVTLPGIPAVVVGSNGHVAWGFTNTYGDWSDLVVLEVDARDAGRYRTPEGPKAFEIRTETIEVQGGEPVELPVRETVWGPVIDEDSEGRPRALAWTAHHPRAVSFEVLDLETARTVDEAIAVAHTGGIPAQNFVVADATGRIGWTVIGSMPRRVGFDGRLPTSWADGTRRWDGWLAPQEVPTVIDPPAGLLWTANNRTTDGEMLARLGDGGYDLGARARQIRDGLLRLEKATPRDLAALQLDDRALFLAHWQGLLLRTLTPEALRGNERRAELRRLVETTWTGRAAIDSVAYRATRAFRNAVRWRVFAGLTGQSEQQREARFGPTPQFEGPLWKLITERPAHLLDPRYESWEDLLLESVDQALDILANAGSTLAERTWGERNTSAIRHPLSLAVPALGRFLDMPARPLPGDENMPRFQAPDAGASERLVVSPGDERESFFHMPGGQSGHPLSPYYRKGHEAWEQGEPTPFLPGPAVHRLRLVPQ